MPVYKLHYFNFLGRAECIRQLLALAGQKFEDYRFGFEDWPAIKKNYQFGTVPVLEVDGKPIAQEFAICRYLAREYGFAGKNNFEAAQVDALADQVKDFQTPIKTYWRIVINGKDEGEKDEIKTKEFDPAVATHFPFFVKALKTSGSGFLVGDSVTWVDILVAEFFNTMITKLEPELYDRYPALRDHRDKIHSIPAIKQWRETRPVTPY